MKIQDIEISDIDIGKEVMYTPTNQVGVISSIGNYYVFVKFKAPNGEACNPKDLIWKRLNYGGDLKEDTTIKIL